jgi:internalin A
VTPLAGLAHLYSLSLNENQIDDLSSFAALTQVMWLHLDGNQISDLGPLAGLTELHRLYLTDNQASEILPLVNNTGIGPGDEVHLQGNPLSSTSCTVHIPALESRGVTVYHDCP